MLGVLVGIVVAYFAYSSGLFSKFGIGSPPIAGTVSGTVAQDLSSNSPTSAAATQSSVVLALSGCGAILSAANPAVNPASPSYNPSAVTAQLNALSTGVNAAASASPLSGGTASILTSSFSVLSGILLSASQARGKAAEAENAAVALGLPGWDQAIQLIASAYNGGCISYTQAQTLFAQSLTNFWAEMQGKIQSGRNGCNYGANCPPSVNPSSDQSTAIVGASNYCSGSIGAACCVGCADLALSVANLQWAVGQAAKTGAQTNAFIQTVFASKYGGANRAAYNVVFTPASVG